MTPKTVDAHRSHRRRSLPHMSHSPIERPTIELGLEDFRRLGVRPYEYRLTVIRQAVARSSGPLAKKQLRAPSTQSRLQLSRVATSAYRVLDPRQRLDAHQRVHVGRILPNALTWAGRTSFHNQFTQQEAGSKTAETPFSRHDLTDVQLIEMLELETQPSSLTESTEGWANTLRDQDLLATTPMTRRLSRLWARRKSPLVLFALAGALVGSILGLVSLLPGNSSIAEVRSNAVEPSGATTVEAPVVSDVAPEIGFEPTTSEQVVEPVGQERSENPSSVGSASESQQIPKDMPAVEPDLDSVFPMQADLVSPSPDSLELFPSIMRDSVQPEKTLVEPSKNKNALADAAESGAVEMSQPIGPYLPDPFSDLGAGSAEPPPIMQDVAPVIPLEEKRPQTEIGDVQRYPVPEPESVLAAKRRLLDLIPDYSVLTASDDVLGRIASIESIEKQLDAGSADHWAARLMIAEFAWTTERLEEVAKRLQPLHEFETSSSLPLSQSFVAACDRGHLPETHEHLLGVGLELADQLLLDEAYQACEQVVESLQPSAKFLDSEISRKYLQEFSQAAQNMSRSSESVKRMLNEEGEIDPDASNIGAAGRHYCLMLRQWERGLPWLVEVSSSRIARLARQELELPKQPPTDDVLEIAQRWDALAKRSAGRAGDSMRLHSIALMRDAEFQSSGLQKLEIERTIDEQISSLPPYLKSSAANKKELVEESEASQTSTQESAERGLSGRLTINGEDIGVQLDYQLGVTIRKTAFDKVAKRLGRSLDEAMIELAGEIEVGEKPIRMMVSTTEIPEGAVHRIRVDDELLKIDPLENSVSITLREGIHLVDWKLSANLKSPAYLRLHDAATGKRIVVTHPPTGVPPKTKVTVDMVRRTD